MKLTRQAAIRILAAVDGVRYDHLVKRAIGRAAPDVDDTAAWGCACGLLLQAVGADPHVQRRLLSPVRSDVAQQVIDTLLKVAGAREEGTDVTPAQAHAAMQLAEDVAGAFQRLRRPLLGYALSTVQNREAAEDILQQACLKLLARARSDPEFMRRLLGRGFQPYARKTVKHACMTWFSKRRDEVSYDDREIERTLSGVPDDVAAGDDDEAGRPRREAGAAWTPLMQFGASCDGLAALIRRCDDVLDRYVEDGVVSRRQREGVAHAVRAVLVSRATGLHHKTRDGRFELWEVLSDLDGLALFGAEILFVSGTTAETVKKNACMRRRELVDRLIAEVCCGPENQEDEPLTVAA